jgi:hypothetical protein
MIVAAEISGCSPAQPPTPPAPPVLNAASLSDDVTVADWQAALPEQRADSLRAYARLSFENARDDQIEDVARFLEVCLDQRILSATVGADDKIFDARARLYFYCASLYQR